MPRTAKHLKKHQFKKGQSGNPKGKIPNPALKALRKLTVESYRKIVELVLTGNLQEVKAIAENPDSTLLEVGIASAFMTAVKKGDYHVIERIAERIIGKIPDEVKINGETTQTVKIDIEQLRRARKELDEEY